MTEKETFMANAERIKAVMTQEIMTDNARMIDEIDDLNRKLETAYKLNDTLQAKLHSAQVSATAIAQEYAKMCEEFLRLRARVDQLEN